MSTTSRRARPRTGTDNARPHTPARSRPTTPARRAHRADAAEPERALDLRARRPRYAAPTVAGDKSRTSSSTPSIAHRTARRLDESPRHPGVAGIVGARLVGACSSGRGSSGRSSRSRSQPTRRGPAHPASPTRATGGRRRATPPSARPGARPRPPAGRGRAPTRTGNAETRGGGRGTSAARAAVAGAAAARPELEVGGQITRFHLCTVAKASHFFNV